MVDPGRGAEKEAEKKGEGTLNLQVSTDQLGKQRH